ncbi:MAG TPA: hypothetical protein V6C69_12510 [Trichormus sp.]|jgi:hypothetical protein
MFAWKEKRNIRSQINQVTSGETEATGSNRRAIGLVPTPSFVEQREVYCCRDIKYQKLLLTIEAKQFTCCLRVMSPSNKSRAAILIYRGRVLGCLYGRKAMEHQAFGEDALQYALADMTAPDTILEVYVLSEEIALAAASLFHSKVMPVHEGDEPYSLLERGINGLMRTKSPGCVIINNEDGQAVCMIYLFGGRIVGIYSFLEGWLEPKWEDAELCLSSVPRPRVMASALTATSIDEVKSMTISLTGLNDHRPPTRFSAIPLDFNPYESHERLPAFSLKRNASNTSTVMSQTQTMQSVG